MSTPRKIFNILALIFLILYAAGYATDIVISRKNEKLDNLPKLESGDLIFQTSVLNNQTFAILLASSSRYSHVGIIHKNADGEYTVIHSFRTVAEWPLEDFVHLGLGNQFTILRYNNLSKAEREAIPLAAEQYIGTPYNYVFYMSSKEIYCSELPYKVFNGLNHPLGTLEKIGQLNVNNFAVHKLFQQRWHIHPLCQKPDMTYDACWSAVMDEPIITPQAVARDPHLSVVYSNYIF